jgi:CubicO group peptidase (beta-lactamase class C family)
MRLLIMAILICTLCVLTTAQDAGQLRIEIEKLIKFDTEIDFKKTPGFVIGVIDGDSTFTYSFGYKNRLEKSVLSNVDVFELGSVTKVYVTYLIHILEEQSLLSIDDSIHKWMPEAYQNPRLAHLKISDLLSHTSGLPKRPTWFGKKEKNIQNPYEFYQIKDLLTFYRDYIPDKKPKPFVYSHTNFALLELIIESATSMSIEDALQHYLCEPMSLDHTFIDLTENKSQALATGYDRATKIATPWSYSSFKASEALKTNLNDALTFLKYAISKPINPNEITANTFNSSTKMWHGWHMLSLEKMILLTHTGQTSGHNAFVAITPQTKTGVVILANASIGTEDLGIQIIRMINNNKRRPYSNL